MGPKQGMYTGMQLQNLYCRCKFQLWTKSLKLKTLESNYILLLESPCLFIRWFVRADIFDLFEHPSNKIALSCGPWGVGLTKE